MNMSRREFLQVLAIAAAAGVTLSGCDKGPDQKAAAPAGAEPSSLRKFIAGKLLGNRWFTRHVVLDRWFLHANQTALQIVY